MSNEIIRQQQLIGRDTLLIFYNVENVDEFGINILEALNIKPEDFLRHFRKLSPNSLDFEITIGRVKISGSPFWDKVQSKYNGYSLYVQVCHKLYDSYADEYRRALESLLFKFS